MKRFSAFCQHVLQEKRLYGLYILPEKANTIVPSIIYTACPSGSQESWSQEAECTMSQSFTRQTDKQSLTQNKQAELKTTRTVLSKFTHCSVIPEKYVCFCSNRKVFTCKLLKLESAGLADLRVCFSCNGRLLWWNSALSRFIWTTYYGLATAALTFPKNEFHLVPDFNNKQFFLFFFVSCGLVQCIGCIFFCVWPCWQGRK